MKSLLHISKRFTALTVIMVLSILFSGNAASVNAAPGIYEKINFQGKLQNANGTNVTDGAYSVTFTLYDASSAGSNLWDETQTVAVSDGVFQVELGSVDASISSVDFNTDTLYLGVKVEADAEMTPRIRFTAVPYAFNAEKVNGLTVTNTTGTLTIPASTTISFAAAFTTSGANALTLTTTGTTDVTLPTTGTLITLAGAEVLTNKTLTAPKFADLGFLADSSGNELLILDSNASAVNELTISNGATGVGPVILATGEVNVPLTINSKAAGALTLDSGTTGIINLGTGNNAKTLNLGTGNAGNIINIGTDNTVSDTITIGSLLDNISFVSDSWSITDAGALTVSSCTGCSGGAFSGEVDDTTNDALTFTSDDGTPPAGTVNSIFRDNTGDFNLNVVTGKTFNVQVAGSDEYNFSASALEMNGNNITGLGTNLTALAGLTVGTASNGDITFTPDGTGNLVLGADFDSGVTIGSAISAEFPLLVRSGIGSNAALAVDQLNSGDIFTASASGVTKFRVNNSGQVFLEDGSAGSPAVSFGNDTNTGFYRQGADLFSFVANGQNALNLDGTSGVGRLMVGDGSPVSRIQINDDNNNAASGLTLGGTGSTDVQIFKSASNTLTIDASSGISFNGGLIFTGTTPSITINSGEVLSITDGTDSISFDTTNNFFRVGDATNGLTFDIDSGPSYAGTGRPTKAITISPEYSGAVLTAFYGAGTDTNITGSMTSDADTTQGTSIRNYYQWERTTDATQHFYTVAVRVTLPADFSAWATTNALTVSYITESATTTLSDVDVRVYNENDATIVASSLDNASVSWTTASIDDSTLDDGVSSEWDAAGETVVVYLRMGSASSNYVRIGDITLNYLAKF